MIADICWNKTNAGYRERIQCVSPLADERSALRTESEPYKKVEVHFLFMDLAGMS
jgi:hypothetical protein